MIKPENFKVKPFQIPPSEDIFNLNYGAMEQMMFGIDQEELAVALEKIRENLCCYAGAGPTCDCKFGIHDEDVKSNEVTGCPEVSQVLGLLGVMTKEEFEILRKRANQTRFN